MYSKELIQAPLLAYLAHLIIKVITFKINVIIDVITIQNVNKSCKVIYIASPPNT